MHDATHPWPLEGLPKVIRADRFPHRDRNYETVYLNAGSCALHLYDYAGSMRLGEHCLTIAPRTLTLTPAGWASSYHLPREGYHWCIHFAPLAPGDHPVELPLALELAERADDIVRQLTEIARLHALSFRRGQSGRTAAAAASAALQSLILRLAMFPTMDRQTRTRTAADGAIERVVTLINERLDKELRVPDLASQAELSQNYLARCFRDQFGLSIPSYILRRRIDVARQLLRGTDLPVKVVAANVGLPDAQHFNKQFRRLAGMSPSAYRLHAARHESPP